MKLMRLVSTMIASHIPVPSLSELLPPTHGSTAELDSSQWILSRKFRNEALEQSFVQYQLQMWRPRLQLSVVILFVAEVSWLVESALCGCGTRVDTFSGPMLIHVLVFPSAMMLLIALIFSRRWSLMTAERVTNTFAVLVFLTLAGYLVPAAIYLLRNPLTVKPLENVTVDTNGDVTWWRADIHLRGDGLYAGDGDRNPIMKEALNMVDSALYFFVALVAVLTSISAVATSLGFSFMPLAFAQTFIVVLYGAYMRIFCIHNYGDGNIPAAGLSCLLIIHFVNLHLTYTLQSSSRQQYLVRIYARSERDMRVEQVTPTPPSTRLKIPSPSQPIPNPHR